MIEISIMIFFFSLKNQTFPYSYIYGYDVHELMTDYSVLAAERVDIKYENMPTLLTKDWQNLP